MSTTNIILIVIIFILFALIMKGKENYEFVKGRTSAGYEVPIPFSPSETDWFGRYKIPPPKWFREQCNKYGKHPPYKGEVGCEDSMLEQRISGSCTQFYCNK